MRLNAERLVAGSIKVATASAVGLGMAVVTFTMFSIAHAQSRQELEYDAGYVCSKQNFACVRPCYSKEASKDAKVRAACHAACTPALEECRAEYRRRAAAAPSVPCDFELADTVAQLAAEDEYCFGQGERGGAIGGISGARALTKERNWCDAAKGRLQSSYMTQVNQMWQKRNIDCAARTSRIRALTR